MENNTRYSDKELDLFKIHIEQKITKAEADFFFLSSQIQDLNESMSDDGDIIDDSFNSSELEMLRMMENRQRKHIGDLKNALIRIQNKSFGICTITRKLIDKRRLMAVPTTSKCLEAKIEAAMAEKTKSNKRIVVKPKKLERKTVLKTIVKKQTPSNIDLGEDNDEYDENFGDFFEDDFNNEELIENEID